jgi:DNA-binding transcriptional ArsR family regulator
MTRDSFNQKVDETTMGDIFNRMVEQSHELDRVFHALSDPTRRAMLRRLSRQEHTVSELAEPLEMSLAAASKHVKTLEQAGLIRRTVRGRTHFCQLNPQPLADADEWLRSYERLWSKRLAALEALLRHPEHE